MDKMEWCASNPRQFIQGFCKAFGLVACNPIKKQDIPEDLIPIYSPILTWLDPAMVYIAGEFTGRTLYDAPDAPENIEAAFELLRTFKYHKGELGFIADNLAPELRYCVDAQLAIQRIDNYVAWIRERYSR